MKWRRKRYAVFKARNHQHLEDNCLTFKNEGGGNGGDLKPLQRAKNKKDISLLPDHIAFIAAQSTAAHNLNSTILWEFKCAISWMFVQEQKAHRNMTKEVVYNLNQRIRQELAYPAVVHLYTWLLHGRICPNLLMGIRVSHGRICPNVLVVVRVT